ncbi:MAG: alanine racemase [Solibacillus sp.]|uniref:alanine racemase n=1 Tax=unclassified Solibacillus TaxID=2637870 RepID=UPI0030F547E5
MTGYDEVFKNLERPFGWVDLDALQKNIDFINNACGNKTIRIATKSVRSVPLLEYIAARITHFSGFMTFTASESVYLFERGLDQLLIGYPVVEKSSIVRLAEWVKKGKSLTFMIDSVSQIALLNEIAKQEAVQFQICIDLNVSTDFRVIYFGTKRSPISDIKKLDLLLQEIKKYPHVKVVGVMGYDAQIAGIADRNTQLYGLKGALIRTLKRQSMKKITAFRQFAVAHVKSIYDLQFVNAGGSGSMHWTSLQKDVSEITVGSAFYAPALFDHYDQLKLQPAAGFAVRVTRKFSNHIAVCHGGGYVASGAVGKDRLPAFLNREQFALLPLEGAGEVQTPIVVKNEQVKIGDTIYMRHAKAGELCERFQVLHATQGGHYIGQLKTYRGDGQCFL